MPVRSRRPAAGVIGVVCLLEIGIPRVAFGQDAPAGGTDLKQSGNEKMVNLDFVGALEDYKRALEQSPDDAALFYNIGRAQGLLGHHPQALEALETFQRKASPEVKAHVTTLGALLADIREHVGYLTVGCRVPGARVVLGAQVVGVAPLTRLPVEAGPAELKIGADGQRDDARQVLVQGQKELVVECNLLPTSASATLIVTATPPGSAVSVDGKFIGNGKVEIPLAVGQHTVLATRDGHDSASQPVVIQAGDTSRRVEIPLQRSVPVTARWWFWTGVGAVVVGGIVITAALLTEKSPDKGTIAPGQIGAPLVRF